jgi:aminopeptidase N
MDRWAGQWLETSGINTLELAATVDDEGLYAAAEVLQRPSAGGDDQLRDQRIAIGLYDVEGDDLVRRTAVELDVTGAATGVRALIGRRPPALALPNDGLRSYAKVRLDDTSLETLLTHLGAVRDPLTRAHGWLIAWDLLRDGLLPARRYVQLVADHAPTETQTDTLRTRARQAVAAANRYGDPANRSAAHATLAAAARRAFDAAAPGSDAQLVWARCRMAVDDPAWTRAILDGDEVAEGLSVDHDLRWHGVVNLAAQGVLDAEAIERTRSEDPTDEGQRRATTALASRPLADAKAEAWALAHDGDQPLALRRAVCAGFHRYDQTELLMPYVDRFVDELGALWRNQVRQESIDMTEGLFPGAVVDEATLAAGKRALDLPELPEAGRRVLLEELDELRRTLRARAADVG